MGWLGTSQQLYHYLATVGADRSPDGKFLVRGNVTSFLGLGDEFCVGEDAVYFVGGRECNLAAGLNSTSYGTGVKVF